MDGANTVTPQLHKALLAVATLTVAACNTTPLTTTLQPMALDYAVKRARSDGDGVRALK